MEVLAIIPARGGSKRIPKKNIADFDGKPVIAWAIETALKTPSISRVLVNTDDAEIQEIAMAHGADVPFLRPAALAQDTIGIEPVLIDTLEWLKKNEGYVPDAIALLMPTNPLRTPEVLDQAITRFKETAADSVVTVSEARANRNPHWILRKNEEGRVVLFDGVSLKSIRTRSQDLPPCYSRNDIAYILKPSNLYEEPSNLYGDKVELFVMDEFFDGDINTPEDLHIALDKFRRR
ncbi:MAG: acylneuraminate cytidylyltransferase family protein [Patescibacteria group bacterium]|jgi:CMP-N-acetylneuraminic acid synthetase